MYRDVDWKEPPRSSQPPAHSEQDIASTGSGEPWLSLTSS